MPLGSNKMMIRLLPVLLILIALSASAAPDASSPLVLSPKGLGPLELRSGATISEKRLRNLFPSYTITYRIQDGDSPSFHYFIVDDSAGHTLFAIRSFLKETDEYKTVEGEVPIDLLTIHSRTIADYYGLRVGDRVDDIIRKRGKDMKIGGGHFDAIMGNRQIFYSLKISEQYDLDRLTLQDALKGNWEIRMISWPEGAWE